MQSETIVRQLRNPASAAVAGIIFSVILIVVLVQLHTSVPAGRRQPSLRPAWRPRPDG